MKTKKALITQILVTVLAVIFIIGLYYLIRPSPEHPLNPVVFAIGTVAVHWYGLLIALSFIPGIYTSVWMAKNWSINPDHVYNFAILAAPLGVIFARLFYCFLNWGYYSSHPVEILYIWLGGLSLYGVIFGGVLACLIYAAVSKISFLRILDLGAPALLLGQAIGRWGNFFNQELFGYPTTLPWKMWVNPDAVQNLTAQVRSFPPETQQWILGSQYFHPTFLYESVANVILFSVLIWLARRKDLKPGVIISLYLIVYSAYRFFEEWVRIEPASVGPFSWGQIGSLVTILVGVVILLYIRNRKSPALAVAVGGSTAANLLPSGKVTESVSPSAGSAPVQNAEPVVVPALIPPPKAETATIPPAAVDTAGAKPSEGKAPCTVPGEETTSVACRRQEGQSEAAPPPVAESHEIIQPAPSPTPAETEKPSKKSES